MQIIVNWLNGPRNYIVGRMLYQQFGTNKQLKELFASKGDTPFNRQKLSEVLTDIAAGTKPSAPAKASEPYKTMPTEVNPVLKALAEEWKPIYGRMNFLRHKLQQYGTDNSIATMQICKPICFEILELEQQSMHIWAKRDYYKEHGHLPNAEPEEDKIPTEPVLLGRFVENCKRQIRRMRKNLINNPGKPHYAQLLESWKAKYLKATGHEYQEKN